MGLKREYQSMNLYQRGKHRKLLPLQLLPVSSSRTWYPEAAGHGHSSRNSSTAGDSLLHSPADSRSTTPIRSTFTSVAGSCEDFGTRKDVRKDWGRGRLHGAGACLGGGGGGGGDGGGGSGGGGGGGGGEGGSEEGGCDEGDGDGGGKVSASEQPDSPSQKPLGEHWRAPAHSVCRRQLWFPSSTSAHACSVASQPLTPVHTPYSEQRRSPGEAQGLGSWSRSMGKATLQGTG